MTAIGRVIRAPGLIVTVFGCQLIVAMFLGSGVGAAVAASLGQYSVAAQRSLLGAVLELFQNHPGLVREFPRVAGGSTLFAIAFWTLMAPVIILRLRSPRPVARLSADASRALPGVVVTTLWSLIPRAVLMALTVILTAMLMKHGSWGLVGLAAVLVAMALSTCALDLARCRVVLSGDRGFHPRTVWLGYRAAIRQPSVLLASLLASCGQWFFLFFGLVAGINGIAGEFSPPLVRTVAVAAVLCALIRVSVAVGANSRNIPSSS